MGEEVRGEGEGGSGGGGGGGVCGERLLTWASVGLPT